MWYMYVSLENIEKCLVFAEFGLQNFCNKKSMIYLEDGCAQNITGACKIDKIIDDKSDRADLIMMVYII